MVEANSQQRYSNRVRAVENYIHEHLDEALDLNRLADIACMSPYHWHRVYHAIQGETIHATVSRLRLQRAAQLLTTTELSLSQIARRSGYSASPPFSRAFKVAYGVSPMHYRQDGPHTRYLANTDRWTHSTLEVSVQHRPDYSCVAVPHTGSYLTIDQTFSELFRSLTVSIECRDPLEMIGVYFDDPAMVSTQKLESLACATGFVSGSEPESLEPWTIPGGLHAVLRHCGPYDGLDAAYTWLFGDWLTRSGHEPADEPVYEVYVNNPRDTAPMDLLVDICLPLAGD